MVDLPTLDETKEAVENAGQGLISWLETPYQCECGAYCEAETQYVKEQAYYMDVWDCPECSKRFYRDRE